MLRPIKSLLTYLQKNASEAFNSQNSDNSQTVLTEEQQEDIIMETITPENHFHQVDGSDQNENTVKTTDFPIDSDDLLTPSATNVSTPNPEDSFYLDEIHTELIVVDANASNILNNSSESVGDPLAIDEFETDELDDPLNSSGSHFVDLTNTSSEGLELEAEIPAPPSPSTPLQSILKKRNDKEEQSDGSDSGLGSENSTPSTTIISKPQPHRSNLKRRAEDVDFIQKEKKPKRSINFDVVQVYYFPRRQGFNCVPSQGGCTLGMDKIHSSFKVFPLNDHYYESRPINIQDGTMAASTISTSASKQANNSSGEESDSDEDFTEASESDMDLDNSGFLQPIPIKQRRVMLKAAGVRKIDPTEKKECKDIRTSREYCGCNCRGFCDPDTCMCSRFGIKCQVDRPSFPCKCTHDTCQNPQGRVEFNPERVRRHYIHTLMRLSLRNHPHNYFLEEIDVDKEDHLHNGLGHHQYQQTQQPSSSTSNNFYVPDTPTHSNTVVSQYTHNENQAQLAFNTYYQTPSEIFNSYTIYDENAHQHQPNSYSNFSNGKHSMEILTRCDQLHDESKDIIGFSADGNVELNLNVPTPQPPEEKDPPLAEEEEGDEESSADKVYTTLEVPKKVNGVEEEEVDGKVAVDNEENVANPSNVDPEIVEKVEECNGSVPEQPHVIEIEDKNQLVSDELHEKDSPEPEMKGEEDQPQEDKTKSESIQSPGAKDSVVGAEIESVEECTLGSSENKTESENTLNTENKDSKALEQSEEVQNENVVETAQTETSVHKESECEESKPESKDVKEEKSEIEEKDHQPQSEDIEMVESSEPEKILEKEISEPEKILEKETSELEKEISEPEKEENKENPTEITENPEPEEVQEEKKNPEPEKIQEDKESPEENEEKEPEILETKNTENSAQKEEEKVISSSETPKENGHPKKIVTSEEMSDPMDKEEDELEGNVSLPTEEEFKDAVDSSRENLKDSSMEIEEDFQDAVEHPIKTTTNGIDSETKEKESVLSV